MNVLLRRLRDVPRDTADGLAFFSRLPLKRAAAPEGLGRGAGTWPLVGVLVMLPAAAVLLLARGVGMPGLVAAAIALGMGMLATGALHEDGLADSADGLGGGATRERSLAIMRDHALGTFGALALLVVFAVKLSVLALLAGRPAEGAVALLGAAALSRALAAFHWGLLPNARQDGLAAHAGRPDALALGLGCVFGAVAFLVLVLHWGSGAVLGFGLALFAVILISYAASHRIGGHTGDTIGATQQLAETALYAGLVTGWQPIAAIG